MIQQGRERPFTAASHTSSCVKRQKIRGTVQEQKMANLPEDHEEPAPPLTYCVVDYFGCGPSRKEAGKNIWHAFYLYGLKSNQPRDLQ